MLKGPHVQAYCYNIHSVSLYFNFCIILPAFQTGFFESRIEILGKKQHSAFIMQKLVSLLKLKKSNGKFYTICSFISGLIN